MPPLETVPRAADTDPWNQLLRRLSAERLSSSFSQRVREIPGYAAQSVSTESIETFAIKTFTYLLRTLLGEEPGESDGVAGEIGRQRARDGVALDSLLTAIRWDYEVIWQELMAQAQDSEKDLILRHITVLWGTVNSYAEQTRSAYLAEAQNIEAHKAAEQASVLTMLISSRERSPQERRALLDRLGVAATPEYTFIATLTAADIALRSVLQDHKPLQLFQVNIEDTTLFLLPRALTPPEELRLASCPLGVITVTDPQQFPEAARIALKLCGIAQQGRRGPGSAGGSAITLENSWHLLVAGNLLNQVLAHHLSAESLLCNLTNHDKSVLLPTVRTYLECGSITETARLQFCHRNTVANRLRLFRDLTGVDVSVPNQAARAVLALSPE